LMRWAAEGQRYLVVRVCSGQVCGPMARGKRPIKSVRSSRLAAALSASTLPVCIGGRDGQATKYSVVRAPPARP